MSENSHHDTIIKRFNGKFPYKMRNENSDIFYARTLRVYLIFDVNFYHRENVPPEIFSFVDVWRQKSERTEKRRQPTSASVPEKNGKKKTKQA